MDWTTLIMGVLLFLPSRGHAENTLTTTTTTTTTLAPTTTPSFKHITINTNGVINSNNIDQTELELCLKSNDDSSSAEFKKTTCYLLKNREGSSWTLENSPTPSCDDTVENSLSEINRIIGALGSINGMLLVVLITSLASYFHSHQLLNSIFGKCKKTECDTDTKEEQKETTPIAPRRPPLTLTERSHTKIGTHGGEQKYDHPDPDPDDQDGYIKPNDIQPWCLKDMENETGFKGRIILDC